MRVVAVKDSDSDETRVPLTPEVARKLVSAGNEVLIQAEIGQRAGYPNADFEAVGASVLKDAKSLLSKADVLFCLNTPTEQSVRKLKKGAVILGAIDPYVSREIFSLCAEVGVSVFSLLLLPRISRVQTMDVLSSQASVAGYRAVLEGLYHFGAIAPMMMTAGGTVPAARFFVIGVGVAGLQAIATARRFGAIVSATDVRPETEEQVHSLGAKFVGVDPDLDEKTETGTGYAPKMSKAFLQKQAALIKRNVAVNDVVITTALVPGISAPVLITEDMLKEMKPGAVVVDMALEKGGNCALSRSGEIVTTDHGVRIIGYPSLARRAPVTASALYARNLNAFLSALTDPQTSDLLIDQSDELVKSSLLVHDKKVIHPLLQEGSHGRDAS